MLHRTHTLFTLLMSCAGCLLLADARLAQTQPASARLPNVIVSGYQQNPTQKVPLALVWVRNGSNKFRQLGANDTLTAERFDSEGVVFSGTLGENAVVYKGKIRGNRIEGVLEFTAFANKTPSVLPPAIKWLATYFPPPTADPATGRHVYAVCKDKVSVINTASHSVATADIGPGEDPLAIAVAPDASKAYVSTAENPRRPGTIFEIDGATGAITRRFDLSDAPVSGGLWSLAISGDGSTLYGIAYDKRHIGFEIVAIDASSGAIRSSQVLPRSYVWNSNQTDPRLVLSGTRIVLDDGTPLNITAPSSAPEFFGNDGVGIAAYPDGKVICSSARHKAITIGTKAPRVLPACQAVSPDGTEFYVSNGLLQVVPGPSPSSPRVTVIGHIVGGQGGFDADGKTLYTLASGLSMVFASETNDGLTTDAMPVCDKPRLLGTAPLSPRVAAPVMEATSAPKVEAKGPQAVASQDPDRIIAVIDGKRITAEQGWELLRHVAPYDRTRYENRLPELLGQVYLQRQIALEAIGMHLDQISPWKERLIKKRRDILQPVKDWEYEPEKDLPPEVVQKWHDARDKILWDAYFSQPVTDAERQELLRRKQEQCKVQVQDIDFFAGKY